MDTVNTTSRSRINFGDLTGILSTGYKTTKENFQEIGCHMGGLDSTIAQDLDPVVKSKHRQFGYMVMTLVGLQACIAGFAWSELMHSFIVGVFVFAAWIILFGVADSLMMNLMNRELARKNSYSGLSVVARIVIIVFTSYLNATMVEMQVFKPEITKSIYDYRQDELRKLVKETDMRVDSLKNSQTANQKMTDEKSLPYITCDTGATGGQLVSA